MRPVAPGALIRLRCSELRPAGRYVPMTHLPRLRIHLPLRFLAVLAGIALALRHWLGVPTSALLAIVLLLWPLGGILVTIDDDLPGGWSNPDGDVRPVWVESDFWAQMSAYATIASAALATDVGWHSLNGLMAWLLATIFAFTTIALGTLRRRYFIGTAVAAAALGTVLARAG